MERANKHGIIIFHINFLKKLKAENIIFPQKKSIKLVLSEKKILATLSYVFNRGYSAIFQSVIFILHQ